MPFGLGFPVSQKIDPVGKTVKRLLAESLPV